MNEDMEKITLTKLATETKVPYQEIHEVESYADVSDGYHTIEELYDHRITLWITLCRILSDYANTVAGEWGSGTPEESEIPWRSKLHHDGTGYDGWFMLGYGFKKGNQITYHVPLSRWDETDFAKTHAKAPVPFDGHTSQDVLERLKSL